MDQCVCGLHGWLETEGFYQSRWILASAAASAELIQHPAKRGMAPVLDLDPAIKAAAAIGAALRLRNQPLQPHQAGIAEQVRPDLALTSHMIGAFPSHLTCC
jgi:hypothetical protein